MHDTRATALYVVDAGVEHADVLLADLPSSAHVLRLTRERDSLVQIAEALAGFDAVSILHLVSHGRDGALLLSDGAFGIAEIAARAGEPAAIGRALGGKGEILLYGCEVAKTDVGLAFIEALSEATGAAVAASRTLTGASALGGDWELPVHVGAIAARVGFSSAAQAAYPGVLADPVISDLDGDRVSGASLVSSIVKLDAGTALSITDSDSADFSGGVLTVAFTAGVKNFDNISIDSSGPVFWASPTAGVAVTVNGTAVGTLAQSSVLATSLSINLGAGATPALVSTLLQEFGFYNLLGAEDGVRDIRVTLTDGDGGSTSVDTQVAIGITNTPPALGGTPADATVTEDVATAVDLSAYNLSDADDDTITLTLGVDRGTIASTDNNGTYAGVTVAASGTASMTLEGTAAALNAYLDDTTKITYTTALNDTTTATLTVTPNDTVEAGTADTVSISVTSVNDAPTLTAAGGNPTYVEGAAASDLFSSVSADTVETGQTFSALSLAVSNVSDGVSEILRIDGSDVALTNGTAVTTATNSLSVAVTTSGTTATVSVTGGTLSKAALQTLIDGLSYRNTSDAPASAENRVITIASLTDSGGTVNSGVDTANLTLASTVTITPVNDAPVIANLDGDNRGLAVGQTASIDSGTAATVSDVDSGDFNGGQFVISDLAANNSADGNFSVDGVNVTSGGDGVIAGGEGIQVGGVTIGTVMSFGGHDGQNGNGLIISLVNSGVTADRVQTLINNVRWGADTGSGAQTFTLTVSDGDGNLNGGSTSTSADFTMTLGNAPVISDLNGDSISYTEGGAAVQLDVGTSAGLSDADSPANLSGGNLTVSSTSGGHWGDWFSLSGGSVHLPGYNDGAAVSIGGTQVGTLKAGATGVNGQDLVIEFGANATLAHAETLIRSLGFSSTANYMGASSRTISVTVTDNAGLVSTAADVTVNLSSVNDAPMVRQLDAIPTFTEDGAAVVLDNNANVFDHELYQDNTGGGNYSGSSLTLARKGGASADDVFSGSGALGTLTEGGNIVIHGSVTVGTVTTNSGGTLVLSFHTTATNQSVNTVLQNIAYSNKSDAPPASVEISYVFNDGNTGGQGTGGALSDSDDAVTVTITPANDVPVVEGIDGDTSTTTTGTAVALDKDDDATVSDPDETDFNGGKLTFARTSSNSGEFALSGTSVTSGGDTAFAAGETIAVAGTNIGEVVSAGQSSDDLIIDFTTADATGANVTALLKALAYQSSETGDHTFELTVEDAASAASDTATVTVTVTSPPSTPTTPVTPEYDFTEQDDTKEVEDFNEEQTFDGGGGVDTLVLPATSTTLQLVFDESGFHIVPSSGETLHVTSIETIELGDMTLTLDTSPAAQTVMFLYDVFFDRTADVRGLTDWTAAHEAGTNLVEIAGGFVRSQEFADRFSDGKSDAEFLTILYRNGLQRDPDPEGLEGWLDALESGEWQREDVALAFAQCAEINSLFGAAMQDGVYLIA